MTSGVGMSATPAERVKSFSLTSTESEMPLEHKHIKIQ